jgi:hypothetical protein
MGSVHRADCGSRDHRIARVRRAAQMRNAAAAVVAVACLSLLAACGGHDRAQSKTAASNQSPVDPVIAVRAAARAASNRRIEMVECPPPLEAGEISIVTCAVTFAGPACQLWIAGGDDDPEWLPLGEPIEGRVGQVNQQTRYTRCE